jgi:hypothetical protein
MATNMTCLQIPYNQQISGKWLLSGTGKQINTFSYLMDVDVLPNSTFTTKQLSNTNIWVLKGDGEICFNNGTNKWTNSYNDNIINENQGKIINRNGKWIWEGTWRRVDGSDYGTYIAELV